MSKRKDKYRPKAFESNGQFLPKKKNGNNATDVSANIYISMLISNAWRNLTLKQKELYLYCKAQYYGEKKTAADHLTAQEKASGANVSIEKRFTMNKSKWDDFYGLYTDNTKRYFYSDMKALIDNGFIKVVSNGKSNRTKNIYEFSSHWTEQGAYKKP